MAPAGQMVSPEKEVAKPIQQSRRSRPVAHVSFLFYQKAPSDPDSRSRFSLPLVSERLCPVRVRPRLR